MINKLNGQSNLLAVRNKFNGILENVLATHKNHYIMDVNSAVALRSNFSMSNVINDKGKEAFWTEVDRMIETLDYNKDKLLPKQGNPNNGNKPSQQVQPVPQRK